MQHMTGTDCRARIMPETCSLSCSKCIDFMVNREQQWVPGENLNGQIKENKGKAEDSFCWKSQRGAYSAYSEIDLPGQEPFLTTKWRELVAPFIPKHALAG